MTHVIIVQCSTKLSYQGKWEMVSLWVCNTLVEDKDIICVCNCDDLSREIMKFHIFPFISRNIHAHICLVNRPVALRGHVTNASLKRWVGILLMPKIDRAHKNYLTPEIWEEKHLRDILWHFDFSTKQYDMYWPPCWRAYSCPPTWRPKLLFAYILLNDW